MQVDLLDTTKKVPCALGEICGVVGMTFHRAIIPPRQMYCSYGMCEERVSQTTISK